MPDINTVSQRIHKRIKKGDTRFNVNTIDFTIINRKIFFNNEYCYNKKYDFVLLKNNKIKIGLQHQHIAKNILDYVIGAGSVIIDNRGFLIYLDNQSGTFQFSRQQQNEYVNNLHEIITLTNCHIYHTDYTIATDADQMHKTEVTNRYYGADNILYDINEYKSYIQTMSVDKWNWVLSENIFDHTLYYRLNLDLQQHIGYDYLKLYRHFYTYGQYEMGRGVGFY